MSPLEIEILIHYYCSPTEYRDGDLGAPAVRDAMREFVTLGLINVLPEPNEHGARYRGNSDALKPYVEALCAIPLPVQRWVLP